MLNIFGKQIFVIHSPDFRFQHGQNRRFWNQRIALNADRADRLACGVGGKVAARHQRGAAQKNANRLMRTFHANHHEQPD